VETHAGIKLVLDQSPTPGRECILPFDEAALGDKFDSERIWKARTTLSSDATSIQGEAALVEYGRVTWQLDHAWSWILDFKQSSIEKIVILSKEARSNVTK
jgi:hypothetical protein